MSVRRKLSRPPEPPVSSAADDSTGIFNERVLILVLQSVNWDIQVLCRVSSVCRKLRAVAKRLLWKELCAFRAPRMVAELTNGGQGSCRVVGGWHELAKLLFFCCGCTSSRYFRVRAVFPGHFVKESRFSKTSGRSFLVKRCRSDVLYVSDPCEHAGDDIHMDDLGIYRGVFREFMKSRTRAWLIRRRAELEDRVRCPYCGARVWSMTTARLVAKSAEKRLAAREGGIEYFVCVNGHLHGNCWLVPLSSDDGNGNYQNDAGSDYDDDTSDGGDESNGDFHSGGSQ